MRNSLIGKGRRTRKPAGASRGSALIEFALLMPLFIMLCFGSLIAGIVIDRYNTVLQVVRNAGSMYARGVDFSIETNKQLLLLSASGLGMTSTGGKGVIYLSTVSKGAAGTPNSGKLVISERFAIGSRSLASSSIGTPPTWDSSTGKVNDFSNQPSAVAINMPPAFATLGANERALVVEVYHKPDDLIRTVSFMRLNMMGSRAFF